MKQKFLLVLIVIIAVTLGYTLSLLPSAIASAEVAGTGVQTAGLSAPRFGALSDLETSLTNIYAQVNPAVVAIEAVQQPQTTRPFSNRGFNQQQTQTALGSGFVWDTQGRIVTNNHVVEGANAIKVVFADGTTAQAKVIGTDPSSDLAVLQVNVAANQLRPIQVADSTQVKVGQFAIAIGNPFGEQNTMTTGIISALGRSLPSGASVTQGASYTIPDVIQTDAPINPGNSGGVLLNADGKLIGITSAIESPVRASSGVGFAIPSAIAQKIVPALITNGKYAHPYMGVSGTSLNSELAQAMNLKAEQRGALVIDVTTNSPAEKAGLRSSAQPTNNNQSRVGGDVIVAIDGSTVKNFGDLMSYLERSTSVNQTVTLTILRDGKEMTIKLTLGARPNSSAAFANPLT
jgi:serine protease Do